MISPCRTALFQCSLAANGTFTTFRSYLGRRHNEIKVNCGLDRFCQLQQNISQCEVWLRINDFMHSFHFGMCCCRCHCLSCCCCRCRCLVRSLCPCLCRCLVIVLVVVFVVVYINVFVFVFVSLCFVYVMLFVLVFFNLKVGTSCFYAELSPPYVSWTTFAQVGGRQEYKWPLICVCSQSQLPQRFTNIDQQSKIKKNRKTNNL